MKSQISHGAGAASLAVIPVSWEPRNSIRIHTGAIGVALESVKRGSLGAHVEGEVPWCGEQICVSLEVDTADEDTWADARRAMKVILAEQDRWDRDMRASAARELTELACEWRESADEEVPEITEESFAHRIELRSIAMDADGSFSAYFDDDDMFFGHCVTAYGTLTDGVTAANMEG